MDEGFKSRVINGNIKTKRQDLWYKDGRLHREDGPALTLFRVQDNTVEYYAWYRHGELHRENEPARIFISDKGKIYEKQWYNNGELHREDGPAIITSSGIVMYYLQGLLFRTKETWWDALSDSAKKKNLFKIEEVDLE
jgi:hypothetical protein